jgi:nucleoside-diphosphate-sugar epimerase
MSCDKDNRCKMDRKGDGSTVILVTGATGVAGRFIVPALLKAGFAVRAQYLRVPGDFAGVEWRKWDFLRSLEVAPLIDGCHAVVHLAAELSDVAKMDCVNVDATRALASAAAAGGARYFAYASSIVVYGSPRCREVDEQTPLLDLARPIERQYYAEYYMGQYARTKVMAEIALRELAPAMRIDLVRPAVVADLHRIVESAEWSLPRKIGALYRRTQYIYAEDAAAAIVHLLIRGLSDPSTKIKAYNICDEACGTFRELFSRAHAITRDPRFVAPFELPVVLDVAKDLIRHRSFEIRYQLGMLKLSNAKLRATGFCFPTGFEAAVRLALYAMRGGGQP